jgi:hypothetical protein
MESARNGLSWKLFTWQTNVVTNIGFFMGLHSLTQLITMFGSINLIKFMEETADLEKERYVATKMDRKKSREQKIFSDFHLFDIFCRGFKKFRGKMVGFFKKVNQKCNKMSNFRRALDKLKNVFENFGRKKSQLKKSRQKERKFFQVWETDYQTMACKDVEETKPEINQAIFKKNK